MNSWQLRCITMLVNAAAADHEDLLVVLLELFDERDEVAVAADDHVRVDVAVRERHLERIERQVDVRAVLVATGGEVALHQLGGMLCQRAAVITGARPIAVGDLRDDVAALLERFEHNPNIELHTQCAFDADFDVVEVDENRDLQSCVCQNLLVFLSLLQMGPSPPSPILHYGRSGDRAGRNIRLSSGSGSDLVSCTIVL